MLEWCLFYSLSRLLLDFEYNSRIILRSLCNCIYRLTSGLNRHTLRGCRHTIVWILGSSWFQWWSLFDIEWMFGFLNLLSCTLFIIWEIRMLYLLVLYLRFFLNIWLLRPLKFKFLRLRTIVSFIKLIFCYLCFLFTSRILNNLIITLSLINQVRFLQRWFTIQLTLNNWCRCFILFALQHLTIGFFVVFVQLSNWY